MTAKNRVRKRSQSTGFIFFLCNYHIFFYCFLYDISQLLASLQGLFHSLSEDFKLQK